MLFYQIFLFHAKDTKIIHTLQDILPPPMQFLHILKQFLLILKVAPKFHNAT